MVTRFIYDESGNLAGEYDGAGAVKAEHIYLGALPVGVRMNGSTYRVHTDYLGTPRAASLGSTIVWKWPSSDPFGGNAPSVATIVYNPRFPGQYFDAESGLHHNKHRAYDPALGRYLQPDPLGLAAGKNPFNYVNQNPLNATDPEGLKTQLIWLYDPSGSPHIMVRITNPGMEDKTYSLRVNGDRGFWLKMGESYNAEYNAASKLSLNHRLLPALRTLAFQGLNWAKAERVWGPDAGVAELSNADLFNQYKNINAIYHVLTFDSSRKEEADTVNDLMNAAYGVPYSVIPGVGQQCATSAERALASGFSDYEKTGSVLPETLFKLIQQSSFAKGRGAKYDFHDIHSLTRTPR